MVKIVATDQICEEIAKSDGVVELVDKNGRRIGILTRPPSEEDVRLAKQRAAGDGPWHTTEEVIAHVNSLDKT